MTPEQRAAWRDRTTQQRCGICGRWARWDDLNGRWVLSCVYQTEEGWEHE